MEKIPQQSLIGFQPLPPQVKAKGTPAEVVAPKDGLAGQVGGPVELRGSDIAKLVTGDGVPVTPRELSEHTRTPEYFTWGTHPVSPQGNEAKAPLPDWGYTSQRWGPGPDVPLDKDWITSCFAPWGGTDKQVHLILNHDEPRPPGGYKNAYFDLSAADGRSIFSSHDEIGLADVIAHEVAHRDGWRTDLLPNSKFQFSDPHLQNLGAGSESGSSLWGLGDVGAHEQTGGSGGSGSFAGEAVSHAYGHKLLSERRPSYFNQMTPEADTFHNAFADLSAHLMELHDPKRAELIALQTGGDLSRPNVSSALIDKDNPWTNTYLDITKGICDRKMADDGLSPSAAIQGAALEAFGILGRHVANAPVGEFANKEMAAALVGSEQDVNKGPYADIIRQAVAKHLT